MKLPVDGISGMSVFVSQLILFALLCTIFYHRMSKLVYREAASGATYYFALFFFSIRASVYVFGPRFLAELNSCTIFFQRAGK